MERDKYWDTLKFALIFLVVYGHVIGNIVIDTCFTRAMFNFIYTFHMPLFIFVSGRFSHYTDKNRYKSYYVCSS